MTHVAPIVRIEGVHKAFGHNEVLKGIDIDVLPGQAEFIIGPSGSGKSTLLRCLNSLERYDSGQIWVEDYLVGAERRGNRLVESSPKVTAARRASIGMVFQRFNLFPNMTAIDNVTAGLRMVAKKSRGEAEAKGMRLLDRVGLADRARSYPGELSGGQQQRVAIARALANDPRLVLFDEPTSALDPELVGEVLEVMRDLMSSGLTVIIVTHEISFACEVGTVLHFIDGGVVVESGPPRDVIRNPANPRTAEFLSRIRENEEA